MTGICRQAVFSTGARRSLVHVVSAVVICGSASSCGELTRQGTASSYLIVTELVGSSGAEPGTFGATVYSDVETVVNGEPTVFADHGRVTFTLGLKDPGPAASPSSPSQNNHITVNRFRVQYIRSDGRNTPGVDVPHAFDGAITVTVRDEVSTTFQLVRHTAKEEAPLAALKRNQTVIGTIAEVTFYGRDQTGREVSVGGRISVQFGNFADPR